MKIKLFGIVQDIIGQSEIEFEVENKISIATLQEKLLKKYPELADLKKFAFAVNETYANTDILVSNNDVVAIIPPVSGG